MNVDARLSMYHPVEINQGVYAIELATSLCFLVWEENTATMEGSPCITAGTLSEKDKMVLQIIEDITNNADEVQTRILKEILSQSAHVEYLQRHGLNGQTDCKSFKEIIPVATYEDLEPDINRIANGDTSPILCGKPVLRFFTSSGTSGGEMKLIPVTEDVSRKIEQAYGIVMPVMNQYVAGLDKGKAMHFMILKPEGMTPGGLPAGTMSSGIFKSSKFINRPVDNAYCNYTSPNAAILCPDPYQSMYSQMLCGLVQNQQVVRIGTTFPTGLIRAIQFLEKNLTLLCNDIRSGTPNPQIITDSSVEDAVMKLVEKPNPELADFIESECSKDCFSWKGIIPRLWPNAKYIEVIITGTMSQYIPALDYYSNCLPLVSMNYSASECQFGFNLKPLCNPREVSYTFIPSLAYFEFLPISVPEYSCAEDDHGHQQQDDKNELVDLVNVKLGHQYEPVITTFSGLYRYRVGDVVCVTGFKNKAPQFSFVCRRNVIITVDTEKTDETNLYNAIQNAVNTHLMPFEISLLDYTSYADMSKNPGHYVLYWELRDSDSTGATLSVFEDCCFTVEESLNRGYHLKRDCDKTIGPLEIKIVKAGTFNELMDYVVQRGASESQYKTPRCIKSVPMVELMNSKVVANYFSLKCPKWYPGRKEWHAQTN